MYRKLKRTWSNGYANNVSNFKGVFPELSHLNSEEMCNRFTRLKADFYYEDLAPVSFWTRLTLPFALISLIIMFIGLPINFLINGEWGYSLKTSNKVLNWFKSLRLQ